MDETFVIYLAVVMGFGPLVVSLINLCVNIRAKRQQTAKLDQFLEKEARLLQTEKLDLPVTGTWDDYPEEDM